MDGISEDNTNYRTIRSIADAIRDKRKIFGPPLICGSNGEYIKNKWCNISVCLSKHFKDIFGIDHINRQENIEKDDLSLVVVDGIRYMVFDDGSDDYYLYFLEKWLNWGMENLTNPEMLMMLYDFKLYKHNERIGKYAGNLNICGETLTLTMTSILPKSNSVKDYLENGRNRSFDKIINRIIKKK